jgi:hypothetical protein
VSHLDMPGPNHEHSILLAFLWSLEILGAAQTSGSMRLIDLLVQGLVPGLSELRLRVSCLLLLAYCC